MSNKKPINQVPLPTAQSTKGLITVMMGGKLRTLKFGTNATALFMRRRGLSQVQDFDKLFRFDTVFTDGEMQIIPYFTMEDVRDLMYCALAAQCYSKGEDVDFTEWNVGDWMDELEPKEVARIFALKAEADNGPALPNAVKAKLKEEQENPNAVAPLTNR